MLFQGFVDGSQEAHSRIDKEHKQRTSPPTVTKVTQRQAGARDGHVLQVVQHVLLKRGRSVVRLGPQLEDERQGVYLHFGPGIVFENCRGVVTFLHENVFVQGKPIPQRQHDDAPDHVNRTHWLVSIGCGGGGG